jgi:hypothetical protein
MHTNVCVGCGGVSPINYRRVEQPPELGRQGPAGMLCLHLEGGDRTICTREKQNETKQNKTKQKTVGLSVCRMDCPSNTREFCSYLGASGTLRDQDQHRAPHTSTRHPLPPPARHYSPPPPAASRRRRRRRRRQAHPAAANTPLCSRATSSRDRLHLPSQSPARHGCI